MSMPLHDWADSRGWDSVHPLWINALLFWVQDHLPAGYRAYLGSVPGVAIAADQGKPDIGVRAWQPADADSAASPAKKPSVAVVESPTPDFRAVATVHPESPMAVHVFYQGQLVAAIELVSPRNKDRPSSRDFYRNRYLGYLWSGVHLLLVDVHTRPAHFSFVDALAGELQCRFPAGVPPHAVSWIAGGPTPEGGQLLDGWYRQLALGEALPSIPLALSAEQSLVIDLDRTYAEAAHRAYLDT
jgi:hypothetical protein